MPYVTRNEHGVIVSRYANLQLGVAEEWINDHPRGWLSVEEAKSDLAGAVEAEATRRRASIAGTSDATKLTLYTQKEQVALLAIAGHEPSVALLAPEASARGMSPFALAELISQRAGEWRSAGLAIDAAASVHRVAILDLESISAADAYDVGAGWPGE